MSSALDDFVHAVENGNSIRVQSLVDSCAINVNAPLPSALRAPALVLAAGRGHSKVVQILLLAGSCISCTDSIGQTAFHAAVEHCNLDVLKLLLSQNCTPLPNSETQQSQLGREDAQKRTPLDIAVNHRNERIVVMLIDAGAPLDKHRSVFAAATLSTAVICALMRRNVAVNELRDDDELTALHWAAASEHKADVMGMLVGVCRVALEARNSYGNTCCHVAASSICDDDQHLRWLIEAGADIDNVNAKGRTPLREACWRSSLRCALTLLAAGADVHIRSVDGRTACHSAVNAIVRGAAAPKKAMLILHALVSAGADIDAADHERVTARQTLERRGLALSDEEVAVARDRVAKLRLDFVRHRALEVCIGLQSLRLSALQLCEILLNACGPVAPVIRFHQWWQIATTVKHFSSHK
jgi:ankyrin repeat protein